MKTPILGAFYVARSINAANDRCVNLFPELVAEGGKEPAYLQRAPGLKLITPTVSGTPTSPLSDGPVRGLHVYKDKLYVVTAQAPATLPYPQTKLWELDANYAATLRGTVSSNVGTNPVTMSDNGTQMFISFSNAAGTSYIYNNSTTAFAQITDPDFPGASSVGFIDGYFVFSEPNSQKLWVTALLDGTSVDPLDFASAEGAPDNILAVLVSNREIWVFGTTTTEVWYNAGGPDFPLERIAGAFNELGCAARFTPTKLANRVFWLGRNAEGQGIVYVSNGYIGTRISTHAIETAIQSYSTIEDAIGMAYQQDGHQFYVLTFPSAGATWVYDLATGRWHERAAWENASYTRHRANCMVSFNGKIIVGDYINGKLYELDLDTYTDDSEPQRWLRSWRALPTGENNLKRTTHHDLQLDCEAGVGLVTGQGSNPQVMLRWSDDGGHTWSNEHWRSMGAIGETGKRVIWRRLGMTLKLRDRVYELSGTDPVKIAIMGAELRASGTNA
jgi:hypothetical protein